MGIPQYFKYLRTCQPHVLRRFDTNASTLAHNRGNINSSSSTRQSQQQQHVCDHLFLDFNCAVHKCARNVVERLERQIIRERQTNEHQTNEHQSHGEQQDGQDNDHPPLTEEHVNLLVIEESCAFIDDLLRAVRPKQTLYIAIDGVPPRSKMVQQRNRRFLAEWAKRQDVVYNSRRGVTVPWDSGCVTPGTEFMGALGKRIRQRFSRKSIVKISDSNDPSEGEQKIFNELRSGGYGGSTLVYGLDADLLILSALCLEAEAYHERGLRIEVLRPCDGEDDNIFHIVDVSSLRIVIHGMIGAETEAQSMREYAVLCSLLGNDFIPGISCMPVSQDSIEALVGIYKQVVLVNDQGDGSVRRSLVKPYILPNNYNHDHDSVRVRKHSPSSTGKNDDAGNNEWSTEAAEVVRNTYTYTVDMAVLGEILERLSDTEDAKMCAVDNDYYAQCRTFNANPSRKNDRNACLERFPLTHPFPADMIRPSDAGWRLRYYHALFWEGGGDLVADACANYLEGVEWSFLYHTQQRVDLNWMYRYPYAPTALDLANHITADFIKTWGNGRGSGCSFSPLPTTEMEEDTGKKKKDKEGLSDVPPPEVQLLLVLPPSGIQKQLVGKRSKIADISTNIDKGCAHYYPTEFRVLTYLKRYLSECIPVLPLMDYERVMDQYYKSVTSSHCRKKPTRSHLRDSTLNASSCDTTC